MTKVNASKERVMFWERDSDNRESMHILFPFEFPHSISASLGNLPECIHSPQWEKLCSENYDM